MNLGFPSIGASARRLIILTFGSALLLAADNAPDWPGAVSPIAYAASVMDGPTISDDVLAPLTPAEAAASAAQLAATTPADIAAAARAARTTADPAISAPLRPPRARPACRCSSRRWTPPPPPTATCAALPPRSISRPAASRSKASSRSPRRSSTASLGALSDVGLRRCQPARPVQLRPQPGPARRQRLVDRARHRADRQRRQVARGSAAGDVVPRDLCHAELGRQDEDRPDRSPRLLSLSHRDRHPSVPAPFLLERCDARGRCPARCLPAARPRRGGAAREVPLGCGRRADIMGIDPQGRLTLVEIKVSLADLRGDRKWPDYLDYCDRFFWAVPVGFPLALFETPDFAPDRTGLIVADRFDAEELRGAPWVPLNSARRKYETLRFARRAAARVHAAVDPAKRS